jgi:hypothetical protein
MYEKIPAGQGVGSVSVRRQQRAALYLIIPESGSESKGERQ